MSKTFVGRINWASLGPNALSGVLGFAAVALIALGIGMIFLPAGVIAAGVGCIALQWLWLGGSESAHPEDNRRR